MGFVVPLFGSRGMVTNSVFPSFFSNQQLPVLFVMNVFRSAKLYNRREPFRYIVTELRTFLRNKDMQNKTTETMRYIVVIIPAVMKLVSDITVGPTVHIFVQSA